MITSIKVIPSYQMTHQGVNRGTIITYLRDNREMSARLPWPFLLEKDAREWLEHNGSDTINCIKK